MKKIIAAVMLLCCVDALAQNNFRIFPDTGGTYNSFVRVPPTYVDARVLAPNVSETHTIPAGIRYVIFSSNCDFHARMGSSAAVPATDVTDGSGSELNPAAWFVDGSTQLTLVSGVACVITMSMYK